MADVVNLNKARKAKAKAANTIQAATNRALHGRTKAQKQAEAAEKAQREALLNGAKLDD